MSRPYLRIDNVSYSTASNTLSVSLHALRIRGYDSENDIIIEGFSQSKTISISNGSFQGTVTYSVPDLETSTASVGDSTTYVAPYVDCLISGTAIDGDVFDLQYELGLEPLKNIAFGDTFSAWGAANYLASTFSSSFGFSATVSTGPGTDPAVLRISGPWGSYYNGLNIDFGPSFALTASSTFTASLSSTEFANGVTKYNLNFKRQNPLLGSLGVNTFNFDVGTYAVGS